jgi:hypothetical protein
MKIEVIYSSETWIQIWTILRYIPEDNNNQTGQTVVERTQLNGLTFPYTTADIQMQVWRTLRPSHIAIKGITNRSLPLFTPSKHHMKITINMASSKIKFRELILISSFFFKLILIIILTLLCNSKINFSFKCNRNEQFISRKQIVLVADT